MRGMFTAKAVLLWAVVVAAFGPSTGRAAEHMTGRWQSSYGAVQFVHRGGELVAALLEDQPACGFKMCDEIIRGRLDEDGVWIGQRRVCAPKACLGDGDLWTLEMGLVSDNDNRIDLVGIAPEQDCALSNFTPQVTSHRVSLEVVDCQEERLSRKVAALDKRMNAMTKGQDISALEQEIDALMEEHPREIELAHLKAHLLQIQGTPEALEEAIRLYEDVAHSHKDEFAECILAHLHAQTSHVHQAILHLNRCAKFGHIKCTDLAKPGWDQLRQEKAFQEILDQLACEESPAPPAKKP